MPSRLAAPSRSRSWCRGPRTPPSAWGRRDRRGVRCGPGWAGPFACFSSPSGVPARLGLQDGALEALDGLEGDLRAAGRPAGHGELEPLLVAPAPGLHPLGVLAGVLGLRLRQVELRLVVAAPALVAHPAAH